MSAESSPAAPSRAVPVFAPATQPKWTRMPIRTRPHRNPLAENDDHHPDSPQELRSRLGDMFPGMQGDIEIVDVGCAFGGMLFALAPLFPSTLMLGLEIRPKVTAYAQSKALAFREDGAAGHHYRNLWFEQLNVMKYGVNCFSAGQLSHIFFCYPDPHWKRKNIRRRIISPGLVQIYAHWLRVGGTLFTVSDVEGVEKWMADCLDACPLFRRLTDEEIDRDGRRQILQLAMDSSEDAQRTERKKLAKHYAVHVRVA